MKSDRGEFLPSAFPPLFRSPLAWASSLESPHVDQGAVWEQSRRPGPRISEWTARRARCATSTPGRPPGPWPPSPARRGSSSTWAPSGWASTSWPAPALRPGTASARAMWPTPLAGNPSPGSGWTPTLPSPRWPRARRARAGGGLGRGVSPQYPRAGWRRPGGRGALGSPHGVSRPGGLGGSGGESVRAHGRTGGIRARAIIRTTCPAGISSPDSASLPTQFDPYRLDISIR